jgi:hypothetical protein
MLTIEELDARRAIIEDSPDLRALAERLAGQAATVQRRAPALPASKGMLSADGGSCPEHRRPLVFDPWSPTAHRCPVCNTRFTGPRHDRRWAWLAHLWHAERIVSAAAAGSLGGAEELLAAAADSLGAYARRYPEYPNRDNVLGPSRLFFSTYLESIWLTNIVAAAFLLREQGALDEDGLELVNGAIDESANLIGDFDEGLSNRQTWHNAALLSAAVWFEDADLVQRALEGPRGLVGHLVDGFGGDGMWYEGENYHLFALRGLLVGADWARLAGVDLFEAEAGQARLAAALRAPLLTALPDLTVPARKDSRFGVSLAQPMYLELWERGVARLLEAGAPEPAAELGAALRALYQRPAPAAELFDSYLHVAGEPAPQRRSRTDLSWWMLATMAPELPGADRAWEPASVLLPDQGVAILRHGDRYASLECGAYGGGHGHPDRLHLTLHAGGVHWLADPGTGSYVTPDLLWYRSTLAHNAPRVDGEDQPMTDARPEMFEVRDGWSWVRARFGKLTRTLVAGPAHVVDLVECAHDDEHLVELPWHLDGTVEVVTPGSWAAADFADRFVHGAKRFTPAEPGPLRWRAVQGGQSLEVVLEDGAELFRATGPGRPGQEARSFLLLRRRGRYARFAAVIAQDPAVLVGVTFSPAEIVVQSAEGSVTHRPVNEGWDVRAGSVTIPLRGARRVLPSLELPTASHVSQRVVPPTAVAVHLTTPPALDGTLAGFSDHAPLHLDHDDQYRRTEEPYPGPEEFAATAHLGWDDRSLYLAVEVAHPGPVFRGAADPPLLLDNEPDLIHSDGVQLYLRIPGHAPLGWLVVPDPAGGRLTVRGVGGMDSDPAVVKGAWRRTPEGYAVTLAISPAGWPPNLHDEQADFDLIVNRMAPDRERRAGQLVWSGGGGWAYLRGDRQDPHRFGKVQLA